MCSPVVDVSPPPARPDPSIYSQAALLAAGATATWDNPDIVVYATPQYANGTWSIDPGWFLNNALVTVRNKSLTVAAINTVVAVSYGTYGIGGSRTPLVTQLVSLEPGAVRQLSIPLAAAILNQPLKAIALYVDLSHPYDTDATNNQGASSSVIVLMRGRSGSVSVPLRNGTADPVTYILSLAPNATGAALSTGQVTVAPGATGVVSVAFGTLPTPPGNTSFTVVARDAQGNLVGGFTSLVYFESGP